MKTKFFAAMVALPLIAVSVGASAANGIQRSAQDIRGDAVWAAQHAVSELKASGIQGLIDDIRKCYDTTAMPAFRCIDLDMAGWSIDSSMGKSLGLNGPTKEYFASSIMDGRLAPQMNAQGLTQEQAKAQVMATLSLMQSAVDAEWSVQKMAESDPAKQRALREASPGGCMSVTDCSK
jgi:hypothetical protein